MKGDRHRRVLRLASTPRRGRGEDASAWPYDVDLLVDGDGRWTVGLSEGVGHGSAGCIVGVDEALETRWLAHIVKAQGEWLVPFLRRLRDGGRVTEEELVEEYRSRHGRSPHVRD
ncbi:hypothetical protein [Serinibacter arcticus]|uniref:Uncharacterized protein n=1 Tax=Serinibacter arcticus TaxID=1655435 RepID=A0A4Z1DWF7_9MICO|nr:hypothetical protein [Serinibacter arcticus]TGO03856.1 hypothetical protein SERN_2868 [Serinibacter arcticus]